jgi:methionyl-tRNA formyltransferase
VQPWPKAAAWLKLDAREVRMIVHTATVVEGGGKLGEVLAVNKRGIVVACSSGAVCLTGVQLEGKPGRPAFDVANGLRLKPGATFRVLT